MDKGAAVKVVLVRHGATRGNLERRYTGGATDEPLCQEGEAALRQVPPDAAVERVYTSGMLRTAQTASILYPGGQQVAVAGLREMCFGRFEGKSWMDLKDDKDYRAWVEQGCRGRCPGGEDRAAFTRRCRTAFQWVVETGRSHRERELHLVVHGGTIMALLASYALPEREYFACATPPGGSWVCRWKNGRLLEAVLEEPRSGRG